MRMKWCVIALVLALAASGCQNGSKRPTPKDEAQKRWAAARAAVLGSLASDQLKAGNLDKSRQTLEEAQRLDPNNAGLRILYGKLAIEQGQLDVAQRELMVARTLDPKNGEADYLLGVVYQRWQKPQTALDFYSSAVEKNPDEVAYLMAQAEMLVMLGRSTQALKQLQSRMDDFSTSAPLHHTIGQLFVGEGDYPLAIEALRQASILAGDDPGIREHLGMAYFYNRQYREAAEQLARVLRDERNQKRADLHIALGECQMSLARTREARDSFETATSLDPSSATAWLSLTKASLQLNDVRRADLSLRKGLALAPQRSESHLMLGYVRLKQDRLGEALNAFRRAHALDSSDPVSLCMVGYVLEKSGRAGEAIEYYGQALKIKPDDELATKLMASVGQD